MSATRTTSSTSGMVKTAHAGPTSIGLCGGSLSITGRAIGDTATTRDLQGGRAESRVNQPVGAQRESGPAGPGLVSLTCKDDCSTLVVAQLAILIATFDVSAISPHASNSVRRTSGNALALTVILRVSCRLGAFPRSYPPTPVEFGSERRELIY
jgi:hypothetical protein